MAEIQRRQAAALAREEQAMDDGLVGVVLASR
jgi:hypothetical protein